jgi:glycosyltransferase involved in cell wall biosynthesis
MNVLVLAALTDATGNAVTARRIARLLEREHRVHLVDSVGATRKSVQEVIDREHVDLAIGVHALLAGPFLRTLTGARGALPYLLVFGGTDLYEPMDALSTTQMTRAVESAARLLAFSPENRARAEWMWPAVRGRVELLPQAVDVGSQRAEGPSVPTLLRDRLSLAPETFLFVLPTGIRRVKDPLHVVDAFSRWHREDPRMHLAVVGAVLEPDYAAGALDVLASRPGVHYVPALAREQMLAGIAEADVVLNTSLSEGMCGVVLEAMALGTPVLARRNAGNQSLVVHGHTGLLYDTPEELVEWGRALTLSAELRHRIARTARAKIRAAHTPEIEQAAYLRIVDEMAAARPSLLPALGPPVDEIARALELLAPIDVGEPVRARLRSVAARVRTEAELARETKELAGLLATAPPSVAIAEIGARTAQRTTLAMSDEDRNAYHLLLGAMQISDARARTGARGVPDEVIDATLSDLAVWSQRFEELASSDGESFGGLTLEVLSWCQRFLRGELVRLGPIQFDLRPFPAPMRVFRHDKTRQLRARTLEGRSLDLRTGRVTDEAAPALDSRWQIVLEPGTPMLEMWFPGALSRITLDEVGMAIRRAHALFAKLSPETVPAGVYGESWRLDPQLRGLFADEVGIDDIGRVTALYPSVIGEDAWLRRIFGPDVDRQTLAQRAPRSPVEAKLLAFLGERARRLEPRGGFVLREELERLPEWEAA